MSEDLPFSHAEMPEVASWKAMRDAGIVKQDLDYSCGAASIATLLNQYYGQELTEEDVLRLLQKEAAKEGMASFADMQRILPQLGFRAEGYALSFEQLMQLQVPVIVYLRYRKNDHFSVLRGIDSDTVLLADPSLGHMSMSRAQFLDAWHTRNAALQGKILAIVPTDTTLPHRDGFFTRLPERQTQQSIVFARFPERY